jgi:hypothetical protein
MTPLRLVRSLVFLAGAVASAACATTRYTQSRIEALPPDVAGRPGSSASIDIDGLRLHIQLHDRTREEETIRHLALSIVFDTDRPDYSFDPGQVLLRTADGREWRGADEGSVPLYPGAVFDLAFGTPVEPKARPELVIGGLTRGNTPLDPVSVVLARHRERTIDRVYWLEGVGRLLVGPWAGM